jgi:uracil-DNA glycosylase
MSPTLTPFEARTALLWMRDMGLDEAVLETPVDRFAKGLAREPGERPRNSEPEHRDGPPERTPAKAAPKPADAFDTGAIAGARALAAKAATLAELRAALDAFDGGALKASATKLVFADGNAAAQLMLVGEAPGRDEDQAGLPFVGVSGQLLDRILAAAGYDRTKVYITNVLPWRPPANREPAPGEISLFMPFLMRHIELVRPRIVLALGAVSAKTLFASAEGITRLRGKWMRLSAGAHECDAIATFHPAALLRNPANKRYVWRDMLAVADKLEGPL